MRSRRSVCPGAKARNTWAETTLGGAGEDHRFRTVPNRDAAEQETPILSAELARAFGEDRKTPRSSLMRREPRRFPVQAYQQGTTLPQLGEANEPVLCAEVARHGHRHVAPLSDRCVE